MNDAAASRRRVTDVELANIQQSPTLAYEPEPDWQNRKVVLFTARHNNSYDAIGRSRHEELKNFLNHLGQFGYGPADVRGIQPDASIAAFDWPRNLNWKALPIVTKPRYAGGHCPRSVFDDTGRYRAVRSQRGDGPTSSFDNDAIARAPVLNRHTERLVVADFHRNDRVLFEVAAVSGLTESTVDFAHFDGKFLTAVTRSEVEALTHFYSAHERFVFNHALNLFVIGGRAWLKAAREDGFSQYYVEHRIPKPRSIGWRSAHPLGLQMLYAIWNMGRSPVRAGMTVGNDILKSPVAVGELPMFRFDGGRLHFEWFGSGRYSPWIEDLGVWHEGEQPPTREWGGVVHILSDLVFSDLIGIGPQGIALTTMGARYLELLGYEGDDPDVVIRWRTEDGRLGAPEDGPSMDRWINRTFRAFKRGMNRLPSSPPTEHVEHEWPVPAKNLVYARGYAVTLPPDKLLLPELDRLREEFASREDVPLLERRCGLIRRSRGFGEEPAIQGFWVGTPLGVYDRHIQTLARLDCLKDWSGMDASCVTFLGSLSAAASRMFADTPPSVVEIGYSSQDPVSFNAPPSLCASDPEGGASVVIRGSVITIEDVGKVSSEFQDLLRIQGIGAPSLRSVDGVRLTGTGPRVTISYGILVGIEDEDTGGIVLHRNVTPQRLSILHKESRRGRLIELLDTHSDMKADGYWVIHPDGTVREL